MTIQSKNDIKGTPNGDDHDAQFDPRPKWPFWIGTGGRFPSESVAAFIGMRTTEVSVSKTCLVRFDNNHYSVAARAVGRTVDVRAYADRIVIRQDGETVAEHPRSFGRGEIA